MAFYRLSFSAAFATLRVKIQTMAPNEITAQIEKGLARRVAEAAEKSKTPEGSEVAAD
jgi:hypothetical protein